MLPVSWPLLTLARAAKTFGPGRPGSTTPWSSPALNLLSKLEYSSAVETNATVLPSRSMAGLDTAENDPRANPALSVLTSRTVLSAELHW